MRLFVGIELPDRWRQALATAAAGLEAHGVRGSFTRPFNYHLTLVFLGETEGKEGAIAALRQMEGSPFSLRSAAPGRFSKKGGDIWWLGVEPDPGLLAVQREAEGRLRAAGFSPEERPYRPHITLARRVKSPPEALEALSLPPQQALIRQITLFSSQRVEGVLRYLPLYRRTL